MLKPTTEADLADAIAAAKGPFAVQGAGTRRLGHPVAGDALSTQGLSGITLYEPGALTIVAQAGTPVSEVEAILATGGQRLPFEPMDHRALMDTTGEPTIGGVVAANVSGPRRIQAGACRDSLIGVRFVDGSGAVVKNGGRVMKNVTGYDLVKLMAGSYGTLGVLTEVSFKVLPTTDAAATLVIPGLTAARAVKAMSTAMGSPFEVSGAAARPGAETLLRIEGFADSVRYRAERLVDLLSPFGAVGVERDADKIRVTWREIRDAEMFAGSGEDVWRISVKPTDGPRVTEVLPGARLLLDWAGGLVWAGVSPGTDVRAALAGIPGHATLIRGGAPTKATLPVFHPEPAPVAAIAQGLRAQFDPRGILNPGLMG